MCLVAVGRGDGGASACDFELGVWGRWGWGEGGEEGGAVGGEDGGAPEEAFASAVEGGGGVWGVG